MSQLNDSNVIKSILQTHCDEMIWYRVPRDAPGSVDLATYMFQQTRMYNSLDEKVCRKVAMKVMYHSRINLTKVVEHSNKKKNIWPDLCCHFENKKFFLSINLRQINL